MNVYRDRAVSKRTTVSVFQLNVKFVLLPANFTSVKHTMHLNMTSLSSCISPFRCHPFFSAGCVLFIKDLSLKLLSTGGPD